jgi:uncharacterized protein YndB with AHSA1/START domain
MREATGRDCRVNGLDAAAIADRGGLFEYVRVLAKPISFGELEAIAGQPAGGFLVPLHAPVVHSPLNRSTNMQPSHQFDSKLDLSLTRIVDVPRHLVWRAWTEPELLKPWFCPLPWKTVDCEIDLRPGGLFRTTMQSPEGIEFPNVGCYLEVLPDLKLVWTNALLPGYRPSPLTTTCGDESAEFMFTAMIELADHGQGTRYTATVIHADEAGCKKHAAMGFEGGWATALDQLVAMVKRRF